MQIPFKIIDKIINIEIIAIESNVKQLSRLNKTYGKGNWRKLKGITYVEIDNNICKVELHWFEAHGIGKREIKIKELL